MYSFFLKNYGLTYPNFATSHQTYKHCWEVTNVVVKNCLIILLENVAQQMKIKSVIILRWVPVSWGNSDFSESYHLRNGMKNYKGISNNNNNNYDYQNTQRKGNLKALGNIGSRHRQKFGDERIKKEYFKKTRNLRKTKQYCRNFVKGAVPLIR